MNAAPLENIIPLVQEKPPKEAPKAAQARFKIVGYTNPRTSSESWRVSGIKRDGARIRENFKDLESAQCRQIELETEYLRGHAETAIRATKLSADQVQLAEVAFIKLGDDWESILNAVEFWNTHGKQHAVVESPRLDEAVEQFTTWLSATDELRSPTKANLRLRVSMFSNGIGNLRVADITPDVVWGYLEKRSVGKASKENDRRAISRFFGWCLDRPRRWIKTNPARKEKRERKSANRAEPTVLPLVECKQLLQAAERYKLGRLVPYVAVCLFGGLRPFEAARLSWRQVNLTDGEIRLEGSQTKTGAPRVVSICPTLKEWLKAYADLSFYPANWRKDFDAIKRAAGFGPEVEKVLNRNGKVTEKRTGLKPWPEDVMRHTAISHYFRKTGSYGQTAEQFGNSEAIIKRHYQGRVSSSDTTKFYALRPGRKKGQQ